MWDGHQFFISLLSKPWKFFNGSLTFILIRSLIKSRAANRSRFPWRSSQSVPRSISLGSLFISLACAAHAEPPSFAPSTSVGHLSSLAASWSFGFPSNASQLQSASVTARQQAEFGAAADLSDTQWGCRRARFCRKGETIADITSTGWVLRCSAHESTDWLTDCLSCSSMFAWIRRCVVLLWLPGYCISRVSGWKAAQQPPHQGVHDEVAFGSLPGFRVCRTWCPSGVAKC